MDQDKFEKAATFLYAACNELKDQIDGLKRQAENVIVETREAREEEQEKFEKWFKYFTGCAKTDFQFFKKERQHMWRERLLTAIGGGIIGGGMVLLFVVCVLKYQPNLLRM